jgi:hypothetical protein
MFTSLLYLKHQFQRSSCVIFYKNPYISSKLTQRKILKDAAGRGV